jgi:hypothetical protein
MQRVIKGPEDIQVAWIKDRDSTDKFLLGEVEKTDEQILVDFDALGMNWVSSHPEWYDLKQGSLAQFLAD